MNLIDFNWLNDVISATFLCVREGTVQIITSAFVCSRENVSRYTRVSVNFVDLIIMKRYQNLKVGENS